jgi:aryl-alcohol dehydrogenase-like predicted oxidoreductase
MTGNGDIEYRLLGGTGIHVSHVALGAMSFGALGNADHDDCARIIHRALDAGVNIVDTADVYSAGESEVIVGKALQGRRDDVVLSTKCYWPMGADPNRQGGSRRWIMRACEESLARLGTDWIDVYYLHKPDLSTSIDESLAALDTLVRSGKVRVAAMSTFPSDLLVEAQWAADRDRLVRPRAEQPPYSIFVRGIETSVLPTCQRYGMGVIPWSPLAGGWLTGRYRQDGPPPEGGRARRTPERFDYERAENQRKLALVEDLVAVADAAGLSLTHLAMAFVTEHPAVTSAIIGPRTMEQLTDVLAGADVRLTDDVLDRIDEIVPPGTNVNVADTGWEAASLRRSQRRRPRRPGR